MTTFHFHLSNAEAQFWLLCPPLYSALRSTVFKLGGPSGESGWRGKPDRKSHPNAPRLLHMVYTLSLSKVGMHALIIEVATEEHFKAKDGKRYQLRY